MTALIDFRERLLKGLDSSSKSLLLASECSNSVLEDLQKFLTSDCDELPQSLKQLAKLAKSEASVIPFSISKVFPSKSVSVNTASYYCTGKACSASAVYHVRGKSETLIGSAVRHGSELQALHQEFAEATSRLAAAAIGGAFGTPKTSREPSHGAGAAESSQCPDMLERILGLLTTDK